MRVEAPTTMMQAYQQGRNNRRQDKLDDQNLAFSVFDEKRTRDKHKLAIDTGEENLRHRKTVNPLMESLRLYENELKWNTLDSDIANNKERTRHNMEAHRINEATRMSTLDNQQFKYGQGTSYLAPDSSYQSNIDEATGASYDEKRGLMNEVQTDGLKVAKTELDTEGRLGRMTNIFTQNVADQFTQQGYLDSSHPVYPAAVDNQYGYPHLLAEGENKLKFGDQKIAKRTQGFMEKLMDAKESGLLKQEDINRTKEELLREILSGGIDEDEYNDALKKIELINKSSQGGGMTGLLGRVK